jgi:SAM-dependent methyltransferase
MSMFDPSDEFRRFRGKKALVKVRGDYTHAGSEEAIVRTFEKLPLDPRRTVLDVGCGLGGTAAFVQERGLGKVAGFDIEKESISYAKYKYPGVEFHVADASNKAQLSQIFGNRKFDLIYIFHSFCVFPDQLETLKVLRSLAHKKTQLVIFEYYDLTNGNNPLNRTKKGEAFFYVNTLKQFKDMLKSTGWGVGDDYCMVEVTNEFGRWYTEFLENLERMREKIVEQHGQEYFEKAKRRYSGFLESINQGSTGGCILYTNAEVPNLNERFMSAKL